MTLSKDCTALAMDNILINGAAADKLKWQHSILMANAAHNSAERVGGVSHFARIHTFRRSVLRNAGKPTAQFGMVCFLDQGAVMCNSVCFVEWDNPKPTMGTVLEMRTK